MRIPFLGLLAVGLWTLFAEQMLVVTRPLADVDAIISLASHEWERLPLAARRAPDGATGGHSAQLSRTVLIGSCPKRMLVSDFETIGFHT
jgi:hypothetical protein